jgi:hypothetical protein
MPIIYSNLKQPSANPMLKIKNPKETIFVATTAALLATLVVLVAILGKNLTYTTRFTPPSTEQALKNQSYFTESQVFIVSLGGLLLLALPSLAYAVFLKSKRLFVPLWAAFVALMACLLLATLYFLAGSQEYRDYLWQVSQRIEETPGFCEASLCNKATCARMSSLRSSRAMAEAFCVIGLLGSLYIAAVGLLIHLARRKANEIELIM